MLMRRLFPDLNYLDDPGHRSRLARGVLRRLAFTGPSGFYVSVLAFLLTAIILGVTDWAFDADVPPGIIFVSVVIVGQTALVMALRETARRRLRAELRELGCALCPSCGYNLTGNRSGICPECGEAPGSPA